MLNAHIPRLHVLALILGLIVFHVKIANTLKELSQFFIAKGPCVKGTLLLSIFFCETYVEFRQVYARPWEINVKMCISETNISRCSVLDGWIDSINMRRWQFMPKWKYICNTVVEYVYNVYLTL